MIKIIEKKSENGSTIYGVQQKDGHIKWADSMPHARYLYAKAAGLTKKKKKSRG
jgi:hypothetical protein